MPYILALIFVFAVYGVYKRKGNIVFLSFASLLLLLHIFSIINGHSWGDDFIVYLAQSKALLNGDISNVIEKQQLIQQLSKTKTGPILYPWGYPVLLAVLNKAFGDNYFVYKIFNVFAICLTGFASIFLMENRERRPLLLLFLLIVLNPFLFDYKNEINADILFMLFTTLSLLCMKSITADLNKKFSFLQAALAGITFFLCTFIKAAGATMLFVFIFCSALHFITNKNKGGFKTSFLNVGSVIAIYTAALFITNRLLPNFFLDYVTYYSLESICKAGASNFKSYLLLIKNFVYNPNHFLYAVGIIISLILFIAGIVANYRKYFQLNLFCFLFLAMLIITPYSGGVRYLLPILPVFFVYIFLGAGYLYEHHIKSFSIIGNIAIFLLIYCFCVNDLKYYSGKNRIDKINNGAYSPKAKQFYSFLETNTTARDTLIFFKPRFLSFYLNRNAASYYDTLPVSPSNFKYLTIYRGLNSNKAELQKILPDHKERKVFDNGDFQIYYLK